MLAAAPAAASAVTPASASSSHFAYACGSSLTRGQLHCLVIKNTAAHPTAQNVRPGSLEGSGYGPSDFQSAYNLTAASASDGSGTTVAIVDAYNDPTAASDLATYRSAAGLPALATGQFTQYNQEGETSPLPPTAPADDDWTLEESLDIDMVSAICPLCKIDLVEANDDEDNGLYIADETAATTLGAKYISNSWGEDEASTDTTYDSDYFSVPGVVYTASAGDSGYGVSYPATSPNVVSVGGTTLNPAANSRGWTESVWGSSAGGQGTGSGCSAYEPQPSWQASLPIITAACSHRVDNDVAADADPSTGAAIYDTSNGNGGWNEVGGTSESSPIIASVFALAGNNGNGGNNAADSIYTNTGSLYEVTGGSNGTCSPPVLCTATGAANTYNGPTGWGTPDGLTAFQSTPGSNTVTVTNPGNQTGTVGTAASLQISATDSDPDQTLTYSATGLPQGLSINSATGLISGTPTTEADNSVTVTAEDTTGASGSASFDWNIAAPNTVKVTSPGDQAASVGTPVSLQIQAADSDPGQILTYSATGLPKGLSIDSSTGVISGTPTTPQSKSVTVTVQDTTGVSGSATFSWKISPSAVCSPSQLLKNPGYETGVIRPWKGSSGVLANSDEGVPAHTGSWLAWFDGYGEAHTDTLTQTVTIPADCTKANLSFWLDIESDNTATTAQDTFTVQVLNSHHVVQATLGTFSNLNASNTYVRHFYELTKYIGQTIILKFTGIQGGDGYNTNFFDDTNLLAVS
jgi:putative Ig domain-containing protein